ncbi:putative oxidoreductase [Helianthus annuus]|nr:putative oxidoreductase [Helianthus annuus]
MNTIPLSNSYAFSHYSHTKIFKSQPTFITRNSKKDTNIPAPNESRNLPSNLSLLEKIFNKAIIKFLDHPPHLSVDPCNTLTDNFAPVDELSPTKCEDVYGSLPSCLDGVYIRNGPNPQFISSGPQHYLDGDGMVHSIRISQGCATFCSRYIKTNLAFFGGSLFALCESDLPYALKVEDNGDVITLHQHDFKGKLFMNMTAHPKIDPKTKEAFAFRYWATYPYITYFRFDANGDKQTDVPIFSMKEPSLTHDLAITQKYAIICDIQLGAHPMNLIQKGSLISFDKMKVPRIGVLPRYAKDESEIKWFEVPGLNILHVANAWDETDEYGSEVLVLVAPNTLSIEHFFDRMDLIQASMEKVTIHFGTGVVLRQTLSVDNMEFPVINPAYISKKNKFVYTAIHEKTPKKSRMIRTIGVAKLDIAASEGTKERHEYTVASRMYGDNCFGGEPFFVARDSSVEEDDGYLVSYVHDENSGESRFLVMDAGSPNLEVVAVVKLPQRVPYGLHGLFIKEKDLSAM